MRERASWSGPRSTTRAPQAQAAPDGVDLRCRKGHGARDAVPPCSYAIKHHQLNSMQGGCFFFFSGRRAAMEGACTSPEANSSHGASRELLLAVPRSGDSSPFPNRFVWHPMISIVLSSIVLALVLVARAAFVFPLSFLQF